MLRLFLLVLLLLLLAAFAAGSWFLAENFIWKPQREIAKEQEIAEQPAIEDPSLAAFRLLKEQIASSSPEATIGLLLDFFSSHPSAPDRPDAIDLLNRAGRSLLFTSVPASWKSSYTVTKGDSLAKISGQTGVSADYLLKINNLLSHNLQIGQLLLIPSGEFALRFRRTANDLGEAELLLDNQPVLIYPAVFSDVPADTVGAATIREKVASTGEGRVAFGSAGFASSEKSLLLDLPGLSIQSLPETASDGETTAMPRGILLSRPDLEEIFLLVKRGTPVMIE